MSPLDGVGVELVLSTLALHLVGHLCALGMHVGVGVKARRYIVGMIAHLLHNVNLAVSRPRTEVHRHHPEGRPCTLTLRQFDAGLDIAVLPAFLHLGIDTAGVDLAVLLQGGDAQLATTHLSHQLALGRAVVDIFLQLIVHTTLTPHLMRPVGGIQLRPFVELIVPDEGIAFRSVVGRLSGCLLLYADDLAGRARHDVDGARAGTGRRISRYLDRDSARLGCRIAGFYRDKVLIGISPPLLARCRDADAVGAAIDGSGDALQGGADDSGIGNRVVGVVAATAGDGHGDDEH